MIKGNQLDTKDWIYDNQASIFEHYLGISVNNRLHKSPFRKDKTPSCSFYYSASSRLYFKDWAMGESVDCIGAVMKKLELSYREAILKIESDRPNIASSDAIISKAYKKWEYIPAHWEDYHFYWKNKKFEIPVSTLSYYHVFPVKAVYVDDDLVARSTLTNPIYAYNNLSGRIKFYRPLASKEKKWSGNSTMDDIQGFYQLRKKGKLLIFTKSRKDVMTLHELGYSAVSLNGEGYLPTKELVKELKSRFQHIVILYDNDEAGIKHSYALANLFNSKCIFLKLAKDITDVAFKYGAHKAHKELKKKLSKAFKQDDIPF